MQEDESQILNEAKNAKHLFMPAGNDHVNAKEDGLARQVLGSDLSIVEFPEMIHGWTVRGDISKDNVLRDVTKAFNLAVQFFNRNFTDDENPKM